MLQTAGISMVELDNKLAGEIDEFALLARFYPLLLKYE